MVKSITKLLIKIKERFLLNIKPIEKLIPRVLTSKINNQNPINRIWAYWASELNIKVVCLQHGIFSTRAVPELMERDIVDFYISLGKQSDILEPVIPKK